ncbi:GNAT family N-acetyltransferase [Noviherbaspirillum galbum]|uniref:GNAT family N-acetyltransferase n=1 Tax=Noviherbaspirillum galbum TaxID=2709383 RepID=A0A6B3STS7_9BURK|nr:GNAT family N-acetyltransferase [Noviherbaspirillum galbum]NEX64011.1 GNAT family N-acetyltransferase [Noviherbaspirillum galbum]
MDLSPSRETCAELQGLVFDGLPADAEAQMARLYGNVYALPAQWKLTGMLAGNIGSYVESCGNELTAIIVFTRDGRRVRVLNEGHCFPAALLERFSAQMFSQGNADVVVLHAVQADPVAAYPSFAYECLEDIVLDLPPTEEAYFSRLGGATRSYIKRYLNKLKKTFPTLSHEIASRADIREKDILDLIALNKLRMEQKGKVAGIDEVETRRIVALAKECGILSVFRIDGRIIAGTINFQAGSNVFLETIAHDPEWNDYRVGTLCCYLTICECIRRGAREYHFLWGPHDYKFRLLGVERRLCHLTIYRSRLEMARHPLVAAGDLKARLRRQAQSLRRRLKEEGGIAGFARMLAPWSGGSSGPRRGAGPAG